MYPFTNQIGKMKVSHAMRLLNFIAVDYNLKMRCTPQQDAMLSFGRSFTIAGKILKTSARNN